ncbi:MAG: endonuclease/exonuclease/phosphatase family protein [Prevotellaceae bacterium]|jgi:endonuclease/exonuclease/phosphatase family metal-dependent hydrolase|nr:endonuclease/exonuclease/phosphatase family protein [Prevotellaceae bacterium]
MSTTEVKSLFRGILILLTFVLAGITLVSAFAGYVHPAVHPLISTLGLAVPALLIANLMVGICWLLGKRKRWALVPLVALLLNANYLLSVFQLNLFTPAHPDLKIATYNVQHFGTEITGYSAKRLAAYFEREQVDILCFQEFDPSRYFPMDSIRNVFAHWQYAQIPSEDTLRGVLPLAVFSRYPLIDGPFIAYDGSSNCSMVCDIVLPDDTLRLINNHLQTTSVNQNRRRLERGLSTGDRRREVQAVQSFAGMLQTNDVKRAYQTDSIVKLIQASPYPVLACGDFNSLPSSYTYRKMHQALEDGFRTAGRGYMYTFRYYKGLLRIDYIFHSPSLKGCRYESPDVIKIAGMAKDFSDHNPVVMSIKYKE